MAVVGWGDSLKSWFHYLTIDPSVELYNYLFNGCNQAEIGPIDTILGSHS